MLFLLYVNNISQLVESELLLYADDTCLICQHHDIDVNEEKLNKDSSNLCDWFVGIKLSINFGEEKTKSILFDNKYKIKRAKKLDITYENIKIKQYDKVVYLGCILDNTLSGESMALHVVKNSIVV